MQTQPRIINSLWAVLLFASTQVSHATPAVNTTLPIDRVLSVVTTDWNEDGLADRAILLAGKEDNADFYLFEGNDYSESAAKTLITARPALVWMGSMWGTKPELKLGPKNALQIISQNESIGRDRWNETLTVIRRNGVYVVAGYTYNSRDTLDPDAYSTCDINYLNGKALVNGKSVKHRLPLQTLQAWQGNLPKICAK